MKGKKFMDSMVETVGGFVGGYVDSAQVRGELFARNGKFSSLYKTPKGFLGTRSESLQANSAYRNGFKMAPMIDGALIAGSAIGIASTD